LHTLQTLHDLRVHTPLQKLHPVTPIERLHYAQSILRGLRAVVNAVEETERQMKEKTASMRETAARIDLLGKTLQSQIETRDGGMRKLEQLSKINSVLLSKLSTSASSLSSFIEEQILVHSTLMDLRQTNFTQLANGEVDMVMKAVPRHMMKKVLRVADNPQWKEILHALKLLPCLSLEAILSHVADAKKSLESTQCLSQFEQRLIHTTKKNTPVLNSVQGISEMEQRSTNFVAEQLKLAILLYNLKAEAEKVIYRAAHVRNVTADEWFKQPAQHAAPWIRIHGRNVDEWLQEWRRLSVIVEK